MKFELKASYGLTRDQASGTFQPEAAGTQAAMEFSMFGLGATELSIILVIVVILFGARRLPEIGAGVGKAIKNFKAGVSGDDEIDVSPDRGDLPGESDEKPPRE